MNTTLHYPFAEAPAPHASLEVAPGVHWLRFALPFALDHINLWLLADVDDSWTLVDCGIGMGATRQAWEQVFQEVMQGRPLRQIIVTHYHPDHIGQAAWLSERFGVPVQMTAGEAELARALHGRSDAESGEAMAALFARHGLDTERVEGARGRGNGYRRLVPQLPERIRTIAEGDLLSIGQDRWQVLIGRGHAPEHACLYCPERGLLISGDQILPTISSNVSQRPGHEDDDPLGDFLASLDRLGALPPATRVLPAHGLVFEGLPQRAAELKGHHREQLDKLLAACRTPRTAADLLEVMFSRKLDLHTLMFAMGECIAHLSHLTRQKALQQVEEGAVIRFVAA